MAKRRLVVDLSAAVRQSMACVLDQAGHEIVRSTRPIRSAAGWIVEPFNPEKHLRVMKGLAG